MVVINGENAKQRLHKKYWNGKQKQEDMWKDSERYKPIQFDKVDEEEDWMRRLMRIDERRLKMTCHFFIKHKVIMNKNIHILLTWWVRGQRRHCMQSCSQYHADSVYDASWVLIPLRSKPLSFQYPWLTLQQGELVELRCEP